MVKYEHLLHDVSPTRYDIHLAFATLKANGTFRGQLVADLDLARPTRTLELHAKCVDIGLASAVLQSGGSSRMTHLAVQDARDSVLLTFDTLLSGSIRLECEFIGSIGGASGLCHFGADGVCTHFEPVYARYAFPCIDEPAAKAAFKISITAPSELTVVSNMPEESASCSMDATKHVFVETPRMSPHLLGFAIGNLSALRAEGAPVPMALYAPKGTAKMGQFALDIASRTLSFFEKFFDQKFPLPKLDLVVTAEHTGVMSLSDEILIGEGTSSDKKQLVASLVARQVSRTWFGHLVGMKWWDDLWLKEACSTWAHLLPLDAMYPEWRVWDRWTLSLLYGAEGALEIDQYTSSHPIAVSVNPHEVEEIDSLSHKKGSVAVNMLYHFLGHDAFRMGMVDWLEKCKNSNSSTEELWSCLEAASGQPVAELMSIWIKCSGFPVIEVKMGCGTWEVSQWRFSLQATKNQKRFKVNSWSIPVVYQEASQTPRHVLVEGRSSIPREGPWIKVDAGRTPLRVLYCPELLKNLVKSDAMLPMDRVAVVNDSFAMMRAGVLKPSDFLSLLTSLLPKERDPVAWLGHISVLQRLLDIFQDSDCGDYADELPRFLLHLLAPLGLAWEPESDSLMESLNLSDFIEILRPLVLRLRGACGDRRVTAEALSRAQLFLSGPQALDSVTGVALSLGISHMPALWKPMEERLQVTEKREEREQLLMALMGHSDRVVLEHWVAAAIAGALPSQEWGTMFAGLACNRHHRRLAWRMLTIHWEKVHAVHAVCGQFPKLKSIISSAMTKADPDEVEMFFDHHPCDLAVGTIQQGLESLWADAALSARAKELHPYFQSGMPGL